MDLGDESSLQAIFLNYNILVSTDKTESMRVGLFAVVFVVMQALENAMSQASISPLQ